jgi:hypothetical protein
MGGDKLMPLVAGLEDYERSIFFRLNTKTEFYL